MVITQKLNKTVIKRRSGCKYTFITS